MATKPKKAAAPAADESQATPAADAQPQASEPTSAVTNEAAADFAAVVAAQAAEGAAPAEPTGPKLATTDERFGSDEHAEAFLMGRIMAVSRSCFTTLAEPWSKTKQSEQAAVLRRFHEELGKVIKDAVSIIRDHGRQSFPITLGKVVFNGRKVTGDFELSNSPEAHVLADYSNQQVVVVIESLNSLLSVPASALEGQDDNHNLFPEKE